MNLLNETISKISAVDHKQSKIVAKLLRTRLPKGNSLGALTELLCNYAAIVDTADLSIPKKCTIIACADHGVAEMNTSAYPVETTVQMTKNYLITKGAVANAMSNFSQADMIVVDMGIAAPMEGIDGLLDKKIAYGTKNCAIGAAMTKEEALRAIHTGIEIANTQAQLGYRCFLPGEMGIANTTSSASIVATICGLSPEEATGRGTNISDARLKHKIEVVRQVLAVNRPDPLDGIDVLAKVGGFELGCIVGIILGAAANRAFVVLDGFNTSAAALIASRLCPTVKDYLMGSHLAAEPAHKQTLEALGLHPYMDMNFRLGEATGSSIAVNLLDAAIKIYRHLTVKDKQMPPVEYASFGMLPLPCYLYEYVAEIGPLDTECQEKCQRHIDNLTKPLHSLGTLEDIAVTIAGITGQEKPKHLEKVLLTFTPSPNRVTKVTALHAQASVKSMDTLPLESPKMGFVTGLTIAQSIFYSDREIIGFAAANPDLLSEINNNPTLFDSVNDCGDINLIAHPDLALLVGVIIGAAHQSRLIVTDGIISQTAACLAIKIAPAVKDYLLIPEYAAHPTGQFLRQLTGRADHLALNINNDLGCTSVLGMRLIDAAIHMVNDMKTFENAAVATANDGPGSTRQTK